MNTKINPDFQHNKRFEFLIGKTIKRVRFLTNEEAENFMWHSRPLVIEFFDGSIMFPQADDEGNDGGAMLYLSDYTENAKHTIIYTL
jgi:hypothetical protein